MVGAKRWPLPAAYFLTLSVNDRYYITGFSANTLHERRFFQKHSCVLLCILKKLQKGYFFLDKVFLGLAQADLDLRRHHLNSCIH